MLGGGVCDGILGVWFLAIAGEIGKQRRQAHMYIFEGVLRTGWKSVPRSCVDLVEEIGGGLGIEWAKTH